MPPSRDIQTILGLLRDYTTLPRVQRFLAERQLQRTAASWKELVDERISPALDKGSISRDDLLNLLRESEEHGQQHVFLYQTTKAVTLLNAARIAGDLRKRGLESLAQQPRVLNKPASATVVDARRDGESFTLKVIETRIYQKRTTQRVTSKQIIIDFEPIESRAVNLFRLNASGLLELRIQSYTNTTLYDDAVEAMWVISGEILPRDLFQEIPLLKAKAYILNNEALLRDVIRTSDSTMRNEVGTTVRFASPDMDTSLFDDKAADKGLKGFFDTSAYCDRLNIFFKHRDGVRLPTREIHVLLGGRVNEFAIPGSCVKEDYEYVLERLLHHNR